MEPTIINFKIIGDKRGSLIAIENKKNIPFDIKRIYYIFNNSQNIKRGFHAHKKLRQVAVCVHGECTMLLDNGNSRTEIKLDRPDKGLLIEEMIWREMYEFSNDCVLMVMASDYFDESDYIRDYNGFLKLIGGA